MHFFVSYARTITLSPALDWRAHEASSAERTSCTLEKEKERREGDEIKKKHNNVYKRLRYCFTFRRRSIDFRSRIYTRSLLLLLLLLTIIILLLYYIHRRRLGFRTRALASSCIHRARRVNIGIHRCTRCYYYCYEIILIA